MGFYGWTTGCTPGETNTTAPLRAHPTVGRISRIWIHQDGTLSHDSRVKRAKYVDGCCKIRETFHFAHPLEKITAVDKYCNSIHGSNIWILDAKETQMLVNMWIVETELQIGLGLAQRLPYILCISSSCATCQKSRSISLGKLCRFFQRTLGQLKP